VTKEPFSTENTHEPHMAMNALFTHIRQRDLPRGVVKLRQWLLLSALLASSTAARGAWTVSMDSRAESRHFSPYLYGVDSTIEDASDILPALAHHGVRLVRFHARAVGRPEESTDDLRKAVRLSWLYGLQPMIAVDTTDTNVDSANAVSAVLSTMLASGEALPWIWLPLNSSQLSSLLTSRESGHPDAQEPPMPQKGAFCFLPLSGLYGLTGTGAVAHGESSQYRSLAGILEDSITRLESRTNMRVGLALSSIDDLSLAASGAIHEINRIRTGPQKKERLRLFCPTDFPGGTDDSRSLTTTQERLQAVTRLMDFSLRNVTASTIGNSSAAFPKLWSQSVGLFQVLSAWGSFHGLQVDALAEGPLGAAAIKAPGQATLCIVNPSQQSQDCRLAWAVPAGTYTVTLRSLMDNQQLPGDEDQLSQLVVKTDFSRQYTTVALPPDSLSIIRCINHPYEAYQSFRPLLTLLNGTEAQRISASRRKLLNEILAEARLSALATISHIEANPEKSATSAHRSLLKLAQAEALLKNVAFQGSPQKAIASRMLDDLDSVAGHLSESSATCLKIEPRISVTVAPDNTHSVSVRINNRGKTTVRRLRVACEPGEWASCAPMEPTTSSVLAPGTSLSTCFTLKAEHPNPFIASVPAVVHVSYYVSNSFSNLVRVVEVNTT